MERFFRRFGLPDNALPNEPRTGRAQSGHRQGSGFFISADGYAVTNNHVVDKAEMVEVTTDEGKTHTAKVIGPIAHRRRADQDRGRSQLPLCAFCRLCPAHRRLGARGR